MSKKPSDAIAGLLNQLSIQQKVIIGGSVILTTILLIVLFTFLNEPSFSPLYSNMTSDDASKVIEFLNSQKIQYKIEDNGKTILVPKDKLYETRLNLAGKGIPTSGTIGYELFDKSTMGMSEFMQKLNFRRSLEGELSRTILGINGIDGVRVHIVFPERTIFRDEQKQPTASVVLKLKDNFALPRTSSLAIVNLVASAVEGLSTNAITLIDTKGKLLWKEDDENSVSFSSTKQYEIKNSVESYLVQKVQTMLDNILGYGNAMIQVNADLNFDQVEKTMETYDPEQQVVVSEQSLVSNNAGKSISDTSAQNSQSSTTNYEIGKTIERVVQGSGNITRLSVAAVINDIPKEVQKGDQKEIVFEPRSPEQLRKLEDLIKNAVGLDPERNDQISLVNLPFQTTTTSDFVEENSNWFEDADGISNLILVIIAIAGAIFLLRGLMSKLKNEQIFIGGVNSELALQAPISPIIPKSNKAPQILAEMKKKKELLPIGDIEDEISDEAINKKNRQEKISNYVSKNPTEAAKLINAWLHEDE
ncbi:MAG: flagellar basal-body MS-ring/collar protein FliF [Ignavibacteriaceae bacterium]|jgi:flagellar M-ring protein FliF|nr:flagellar basal-body MS-ring/collar protein FliF [Ignavibacteriaceae bacterium]